MKEWKPKNKHSNAFNHISKEMRNSYASIRLLPLVLFLFFLCQFLLLYYHVLHFCFAIRLNCYACRFQNYARYNKFVCFGRSLSMFITVFLFILFQHGFSAVFFSLPFEKWYSISAHDHLLLPMCAITIDS